MSAGFFSNVTCQTSPYIMNNEHLSHKNSSDHFNQILPTLNNSSTCIRRTLSADMSSPKWLENNGFNLKKVQSSHQLQALGEEHHHGNNNNDHDHNKGPAFEDIWSSIQADKRSWGSILSPTKNDGSGSGSGSGSGQVPAPYVHPLAKRRASSLSEKSLEICTESLGSETGSDGFSYSSSEPEDSDKEHEPEHEHEAEEEREKEKEQPEMVVEVKEYNNFGNASQMGNHKYNSKCNSYRGPTTKRSMMVPNGRPSFPPPLPSLANRNDGSNLHIRSHRQDGRLVVEAVSVPSQNCFRAQRQDGRLLLTLTAATDEQEQEQEQDEVVNDDNDEVVSEDEDGEKGKDEELGEQKTGIVMLDDYVNEVGEEELEVINVQRSCPTLTMTMSKLLNKSTWPRDYNKNVIKTLDDVDEDVVDDEDAEIQSLLSQSGVSTATASLNGYEYYWRRNNSNNPTPTAVAVLNQLAGQQNNNNIYADAPQVEKDNTKGNKNKHLLFAAHNTKGVALAQQEVVLVKAAGRRGGTASTQEKGEYLVPFMLRGCKDHNKSFFLLDPYCIATS